MTSELLGQIVAAIPGDFAHPDDDAPATRDKMAPLHGHPLAPDTVVAAEAVGGVRTGRLSRPSSRPDRGLVLFCHGGAFVSCDLEAYLFYAEIVADRIGLDVVTVDYRLAPEHRGPAALDDCTAVYRGSGGGGSGPRATGVPRRLLRRWAGPGHGGAGRPGRAAATRGGDQPVGLGGPRHGGLRTGRPEPSATRSSPRGSCGPGPATTWARASTPAFPGPPRPVALWRGCPRCCSRSGEIDLCRRDAERLAIRARSSGVEAVVDVVDGGIHGVQGLVTVGVPEAVAAWEAVRRFTDGLLPR